MTIGFPNIINQDGQAHYHRIIINAEENLKFFNELLHKIEWANENLIMFGKEITTKRKVAFYADSRIDYTYSNKTKKGLEWSMEGKELDKYDALELVFDKIYEILKEHNISVDELMD